MSTAPTFFCGECGGQIGPIDTKFCPHCGVERWKARTQAAPNPLEPLFSGRPAPPQYAPKPSASKGHPGAGATIGVVLGLLVGLYATKLINQAMCPHSILGPCSSLTHGGTVGVVVLGVVVGLIAGAIIGGSVGRK